MTVSGISARDAVIGLGDSATLTCTLYDAPKAPDYVIWKNRDVTVEEFKSVSGYSISVCVYYNCYSTRKNVWPLQLIRADMTRADILNSWACFLERPIRFKAYTSIFLRMVIRAYGFN